MSVVLETDRLVLREFREGDWPAVHAYASRPEVVRYMPWGPNTEEESRAFVARAMAHAHEEPRREWELAVVVKGQGALIGGAGLHLRAGENSTAYLGYCYAEAHWGRGYGTEAAGGLIGLGFGRLGLHRICATCDVENVASARVMEKNGMQREGLLRRNMWVRDHWRDSYLYAILADEWQGEGG